MDKEAKKSKENKENKENIVKDNKDNINDKKNEKISDENIFRTISSNILVTIKQIGITNEVVGLIYTYVHFLIIFLVGFIFSFNNNIYHLIVVLILISLDALSVVVLHGCPLTLLEQKYLNTNTCEERSEILKNSKIVYKCEHEYEKQIELLINVWTLIAVKCLILIFLKTFNCKLKNFHSIYV